MPLAARHVVARRPIALFALAALALLSNAGCAFSDGEPWGWIEVEVQNAAPGSTTSPRITSVNLELATLRLLSESSASSAPAEFDPASPPPGFSLCHGGHCHADDGRLVPYEDVLRESASGPQVISAIALDEALSPGDSARGRLKITRRGTLSAAEVELNAMELHGTLPHQEATVAYRANIPVKGLRLTMPLDLLVDASSPLQQTLDAKIYLNGDITEGLDLQQATFEEDGTLRITNTRNRALAEELLERVALQLELSPASM
ncbi:hypothetical protein EA187_02710 [Lujinxingia sediminis]|uniref:Lipoprotein n=1 Tax=Lujinxingia sediminis TaxID=2480984 RepID=A0ABY0CXQ5_9DELT|nr:hypothetical protein [Lujinxingia sediminis]RVU48366.1 hypothetical protein EA187_02710 [Lujinxingia sediminis]